jgi:uncharacterized protein (TIGR00299 family) protein
MLYLDAPSGLAGDMSIAALVALGVPFRVVEEAVHCLGLEGVLPVFEFRAINGIRAGAFRVEETQPQPHRDYAGIDAMLAESTLAPRVKELARQVFRRLAEAESEVHGVDIAHVHFHEVGAADAIVDIVGAAACIEHLGADLVVSPLPLGHGHVHCAHGVLPLPAPATLLCLRGVPTYPAGIEGELVTPTGAAIVSALAQRFERWPAMKPERVGYGRGTRQLADRTNALRAVLGEPAEARESAARAPYCVLSANVDDLTGELGAHAIAQFMTLGALDAWATPILMKKGRPALTLSVLVRSEQRELFAERLLVETSSIGLRFHFVERVERPRQIVEVETRFGAVPVKVSGGAFGAPQVKPEFERCVELAAEHGVAVREVIAAALQATKI